MADGVRAFDCGDVDLQLPVGACLENKLAVSSTDRKQSSFDLYGMELQGLNHKYSNHQITTNSLVGIKTRRDHTALYRLR